MEDFNYNKNKSIFAKNIFSPPKEPEMQEKHISINPEDRLNALNEIEEALPFIHITRPPTDEFLDIRRKKSRSLLNLKKIIMNSLAENIDHRSVERMSEKERRKFYKKIIVDLVNDISFKQNTRLTDQEKESLILDIEDEIYGLGPIEQLMRDADITEIMVNGYNNILVELKGQIEVTPLEFYNNEHLLSIIQKIISPLGRRIDESSPMVDARLPDGSRVNAVIPPVSIDGPILTIRKFSKDLIQMLDLIKWGTLNEEAAKFLSGCVQGKLNIIISGGTGSGKTTLLNVLGTFIPGNERIVTIEDAAELKLRLYHGHVVRMEAKPANIEGHGAIDIRTLVINSLRMRPDRIVVGEVRGEEAYDMLQAMNTGHDGSITTAHANSPENVLVRLESMIMMAKSEIPSSLCKNLISSALNLIVHVERLPDGSRRVMNITEVCGIDSSGNIEINDIFRFIETGLDENEKIIGSIQNTGYAPTFIEKLKRRGIFIT